MCQTEAGKWPYDEVTSYGQMYTLSCCDMRFLGDIARVCKMGWIVLNMNIRSEQNESGTEFNQISTLA